MELTRNPSAVDLFNRNTACHKTDLRILPISNKRILYSIVFSSSVHVDVEMLGFRANGRERTPEMSSVQKGGFIKAQG